MKTINKNPDFPYKWKHKCKICSRIYGTDFKSDSGKCPYCEEQPLIKRSIDRSSTGNAG